MELIRNNIQVCLRITVIQLDTHTHTHSWRITQVAFCPSVESICQSFFCFLFLSAALVSLFGFTSLFSSSSFSSCFCFSFSLSLLFARLYLVSWSWRRSLNSKNDPHKQSNTPPEFTADVVFLVISSYIAGSVPSRLQSYVPLRLSSSSSLVFRFAPACFLCILPPAFLFLTFFVVTSCPLFSLTCCLLSVLHLGDVTRPTWCSV